MSGKTQADIAVFEQVYTSASALLDRTHGDLGVVCETVGFPREIQADLDRLNSYQPLEVYAQQVSRKTSSCLYAVACEAHRKISTQFPVRYSPEQITRAGQIHWHIILLYGLRLNYILSHLRIC